MLDKAQVLWYNIYRSRECGYAGVAQWQSSWFVISRLMVRLRSPAPFGRATVQSEYGGFPERPKGADCKSVVTDFGGPNPPSPTNKKRTFVYRQMFSFCLSKPQAWHIITAQRAVHIIKGGEPPLYLITRQRASYLRLADIQTFGLMIYRNKLRMIYTPSAWLGCENAKSSWIALQNMI